MAPVVDVVVIGAGFAGLSAAVRVAREGGRVLLLEARARLGGRATAFPDRDTGELVDNGQHVLLGCYRETFAFLRDINAADNVTLQRQLAVAMIDRGGRRSRLICPSLPSPLDVIAGVFEWDALSWRDRFSILGMVKPLTIARRAVRVADGAASPLLAASPGETVENWLIRNGQTARIREMLWDPLALAALNQPAAIAAAPVFARVLGEMFSGEPQAASIALPNKPLHLTYAEPARAFIESHGGVVRTGAQATVAVDREAVVAVEALGERWTPAHVIVAVPWFAFADVFPDGPPPLQAIVERARAMVASPIVTVDLWFDRAVLDEPFIGLPGRAMQWVFNRSSYVSLVSSGAEALFRKTNDELVTVAHTELLEAVPDARRARLIHSAVIREPRATFSLAPGQPPRPAAETGVRGLWLAGDWTDTALPATIESAVRSGHRAARLATRA